MECVFFLTFFMFNRFDNRGESQSQPQNIMYDKRVVRGSNYSHIHMQAVSEDISKFLTF